MSWVRTVSECFGRWIFRMQIADRRLQNEDRPSFCFTAAAFRRFRLIGISPPNCLKIAFSIIFININCRFCRVAMKRYSAAWRAWRLVNYKHGGPLDLFRLERSARESDIANLGVLEFDQGMSMLEQIEELVERLSVADQRHCGTDWTTFLRMNWSL